MSSGVCMFYSVRLAGTAAATVKMDRIFNDIILVPNAVLYSREVE